MTSLVTLGQTMAVIRGQEVGPFSRGSALRLTLAGAETNVATGVSRLGVGATWIGHLGDDSLGAMIRRELRGEGVNVLAATDRTRPTGVLIAERRSSSQTRIWYYRRCAAGAGLSADDVDGATIGAHQLLHVTGITPCLGPEPAGAVAKAIDVAREHRILVSVDLNYRSSITTPDEFCAATLPLIGGADIVFATIDEARLVTGEHDPARACDAIHRLGPGEVVLKFGADGSLLSGPEGRLRQPAVPTAVVDTVGAGDAFAAGYLAARLTESDWAGMMLQAARVASLAIGSAGDWEGLPTRDDLAVDGIDEVVLR